MGVSNLTLILRILIILQIGALQGYENVNAVASDLWESVYPTSALVALTDTFSTEVFFKVFPSFLLV